MIVTIIECEYKLNYIKYEDLILLIVKDAKPEIFV